MTKYLITPTLHGSYYWYVRMDSKSKQDFLDTLTKKEIEKTEAMLDGIRFEDDVQAHTENKFMPTGQDPEYIVCVKEISAIVKGGLWQERVYKDVQLRGDVYLLYGKSDVIKRDWIYDIKFTKNYDIGKFKDSIQHLVYMYCTGIEKFAYLITDGKNVWREEYFWESDSKEKLFAALANLVGFINLDDEFRAAYQQFWQSKPKEDPESNDNVVVNQATIIASRTPRTINVLIDTQGTHWRAFCQELAEMLQSAPDSQAFEAWINSNTASIGKLAEDRPKLHSALAHVISARRHEFAQQLPAAMNNEAAHG